MGRTTAGTDQMSLDVVRETLVMKVAYYNVV